jgi:hypothetical protein
MGIALSAVTAPVLCVSVSYVWIGTLVVRRNIRVRLSQCRELREGFEFHQYTLAASPSQ